MDTQSDEFWINNRIGGIAAAAVIALLLNGGMRLFNVWLSPTERVLNVPIFTVWVVQIGLFVLLVLNFMFRASKTGDMTERGRTLYTAAIVYAVVGLLSVPIANQFARPVQQRGYEAFVAENQFLIDAITAFEADYGRPPESFLELQPDYLDADVFTADSEDENAQLEWHIPYESIDRVSAENVLYDYRPPDDNDPWRLQVSIYLGSFQSIRFIYNPEEQYSNRYGRVESWAVDD